MLIRQLEYLVALHRERHFGRAARSCWVSQPTLSEGIARLESELGVLIVRRGRRYEGFTPEGERLLAWAQRLLSERDELVGSISRGGAGAEPHTLAGRVRLGVIPTALPPVPMITDAVTTLHAGVQFEVLSQSSADIHRHLRAFELDAAVTYLEGDSDPEDLVQLPLYREHYVLVTPHVGPVQKPGPISWEEAADLPLCLLTAKMQTRQVLDAQFAQVQRSPEPGIQADSVAALMFHLQSGRWSSIVPVSWLRLFGLPGVCRTAALPEPSPAPRIGLVALRHDPLPALVRALLDIVATLDVEDELEDAPSLSPDRPVVAPIRRCAAR